ncbi:hypothetical protein V8C42DRAFT_290479 [Trichoderma barbatum]
MTTHIMDRGCTTWTASCQGKEKEPSIRFLNLTNPNDATKSDALTIIRSHVAKNTHGRKQESRRAHLEIRQYRPATRLNKTNSCRPQEELDTKQMQKGEEPNLPVTRQQKAYEKAKPVELEIWMPNPQTFTASNRRNTFQNTTSVISDSENLLIEHYVSYVVDHGYTDCVHAETEQLLLQNVRSQFVPWSLTERGLRAGLFMAACRSLLGLHPENDSYRVLLLKYKSECIKILRAALSVSDGGVISDHTIALALVLATEEWSTDCMAKAYSRWFI